MIVSDDDVPFRSARPLDLKASDPNGYTAQALHKRQQFELLVDVVGVAAVFAVVALLVRHRRRIGHAGIDALAQGVKASRVVRGAANDVRKRVIDRADGKDSG